MKSLLIFSTVFINILIFGQKDQPLEIFAKVKNDSLITVLIKNLTKDSLVIYKEDSKFYMIKEFKNNSGVWKPFDFWKYSTCGNSYLEYSKIPPEKFEITEINFNKGKFPAEIRVKFFFKDQIYYSNSIKLKINFSKIYTKKDLQNNSVYNKVLKISDEKLAKKVVFLEPLAMKEYADKYNEWFKQIMLKRKKINAK